MFLKVLLAALVLGSYMLWSSWNHYRKKWKDLRKLPGPRPMPIIGNVLQLGLKPEDYFTTMRRWIKQFNYEMCCMYAGFQPYVTIANPRTVEKVLASANLGYKADVYTLLKPWLGEGLLTANGERWAKHRKMLTPSFHFQILQSFLVTINETTDRFMNLLGKYADRREMFDFQDVVALSTVDVICESAMGIPVNTIDGNKCPFVKAMNDICYIVPERACSYFKRFDMFFNVTPYAIMQRRALKVMRTEFSRIIEERRKVLEANAISANISTDNTNEKRQKMAFLDNLLTAEIDGKPLSCQVIFEEVSTFMFEGHDTTASALTFIVYCLSRHAEIQQKAYMEQVELFGGDPSQQATYAQLSEMKYLDLVIKEGLRLFPSVPFIMRTLLEKTEIDGKVLPKDTTLLISIIDVCSNERVFSEPFKFKPERFENMNDENVNPFAYVPFSAGPRNCIGQKFAVMEMKVTLSKIIRHFEILPAVDGLPAGIHDPTDPLDKPNNPYDVRLACYVTLKSVNGVQIRLKKRTTNAAKAKSTGH